MEPEEHRNALDAYQGAPAKVRCPNCGNDDVRYEPPLEPPLEPDEDSGGWCWDCYVCNPCGRSWAE